MCFLVRNKEDGIIHLKSCKLSQLLLQLFGNKLINGPLIGKILQHFQIPKTAHADLRCKFQHLFVEALGLTAMDLNSADRLVLEGFKSTLVEKF